MQRNYAGTRRSALSEPQWDFDYTPYLFFLFLFPLMPSVELITSLCWHETLLFYFLAVSLRGIIMWVFGFSCDGVRISLF